MKIEEEEKIFIIVMCRVIFLNVYVGLDVLL